MEIPIFKVYKALGSAGSRDNKTHTTEINFPYVFCVLMPICFEIRELSNLSHQLLLSDMSDE